MTFGAVASRAGGALVARRGCLDRLTLLLLLTRGTAAGEFGGLTLRNFQGACEEEIRVSGRRQRSEQQHHPVRDGGADQAPWKVS